MVNDTLVFSGLVPVTNSLLNKDGTLKEPEPVLGDSTYHNLETLNWDKSMILEYFRIHELKSQ